jgi:ABC-type sugar transport system ATPase subunit
MSDLAVRTEDVWKIYPQEPEPVQAVRGLTLEIERGDFVAMAGPSGSGKTTVLNLLGGLTDATRGRIWIGGEELTGMSERERAKLRLERIGFVFQAYNLLPVLTALENSCFGACRRRSGTPACTGSFERSGWKGWPTADRGVCPGGSNSAWPWPGPSSPIRLWSWPMNRRPTSTP